MSAPLGPQRGRGTAAVLVLVAVLAVGGAVAAESLLPPRAVEPPQPVALETASRGWWYCPWASPDPAVLSIAGATDAPTTATIVRYVDGVPVEDPPVVVAPGEPHEVALPPEEAARPLAVRWEGAPAVVQWRIASPADPDPGAGMCQPVPSPTWHVAGLVTTLGSSSRLHLFNPFGEDAVARVVFGTGEGRVELVIADELLVAAGTARQLDLATFRPESTDLAVTVEVRTGRLVAGGDVTFGVPEAVDVPGPVGRALVEAVPEPLFDAAVADAWSTGALSSWLSLYNPAPRDAAVAVAVTAPLPDAPALAAEITVPAGGTTRIDLDGTSGTARFGARVESRNDVPVVVTRVTSLAEGERRGVAAAVTTPLDDRWAAPGAPGGVGSIGITNPAGEPVGAALDAGVPLPETWTAGTIGPNEHAAFPLADVSTGLAAVPVRATADQPVAVGMASLAETASAFWSAPAAPGPAWAGPAEGPAVVRDPSLSTTPVRTEPPVEASPQAGDEEPGEGVLDDVDDATAPPPTEPSERTERPEPSDATDPAAAPATAPPTATAGPEATTAPAMDPPASPAGDLPEAPTAPPSGPPGTDEEGSLFGSVGYQVSSSSGGSQASSGMPLALAISIPTAVLMSSWRSARRSARSSTGRRKTTSDGGGPSS